MYEFAKLNDSERRVVFENTASKLNMNQAIIEKDFWVCLILDYLFNKSEYKNNLAFKGGTCLSKVYNLIDRFSEDIDLILDWRLLGYNKSEPWKYRSNTKQDEFNKDAINRQNKFLKDEFLPKFADDIKNILNKDINIYIADDALGVINFDYPKTIHNNSILQVIKLEIGALAAWTPTKKVSINSYIDKCYPDLFKYKNINILATTEIRTFWEKATILHQEANRPIESKMPLRYSRHYYDLYCMNKKGITDKALLNTDLLIDVSEFKNKFYPRKWADYKNAKVGTLKLMPSIHNIDLLKKDYANMKEMIYGEYPNFDKLLEIIKNIEIKINNK